MSDDKVEEVFSQKESEQYSKISMELMNSITDLAMSELELEQAREVSHKVSPEEISYLAKKYRDTESKAQGNVRRLVDLIKNITSEKVERALKEDV